MEKQNNEKSIARILRLFHKDISVDEIELFNVYLYIFENSDFLPFLNDAELAETVIYLRDEKENNQLSNIIELEDYFKKLKEEYASFIDTCMLNIELEEASKANLRLSVDTNIIGSLCYYDFLDDNWKLEINDIFQRVLHQPWMSGVDIIKKAVLKTFDGGKKWRKESNWDAKVIVAGHGGAGKSALCEFQYEVSRKVMVKGIVADKPSGDPHDWDFGGEEYYHGNYNLFCNHKQVIVYLWRMNDNDVIVGKPIKDKSPGVMIEKSGWSLEFVDEFNFKPRQYKFLFLNACYSVSLDIDILNEDLVSPDRVVSVKKRRFIQSIGRNIKQKKTDHSYSKKAIKYVRALIEHLQPLVNEV